MKSQPIDIRRTLGTLGALTLLASGSLLTLNCGIVVPRQGWSSKWGPLVPHGKFEADCGICHIPERWDVLRSDFSFDHEKETGRLLEGAHARAACLRCHNDRGPVRFYASKGCWGCHEDPHQAQMGLECTRCHSQENWRPGALMAEHQRTRFPLLGLHAITPCESCHAQAPVGNFRGASPDCALCHQADLARATSPDHLALGMVSSCERCHSPLGWDTATFIHDFFPLLGGHSGVPCAQCHTNGKFTKRSIACSSCHAALYQSAPNHVANNYSHDCSRCHSILAWRP